ncbi:MAG: hypothetical protein ACC707_02960 [Thiohalomonadales bacterium]
MMEILAYIPTRNPMTIMPRKTKNVVCTLLGAFLLFCSTAEAVDTTLSGETKKSTAEKSSLRCWQQGKLIFTELDWHSFTVTNKDNVLNFTHSDESDATLSLINMGESICVYKK